MQGYNSQEVTKTARNIAEMVYLKKSLSGIDVRT
jgi:hypothetical protein